MINNIEFVISWSNIGGMEELPEILEGKFGSRILRWFISDVTETEIFVEITLSEKEKYPLPQNKVEGDYPGKGVVVSIIPTGIGCEIGGVCG